MEQAATVESLSTIVSIVGIVSPLLMAGITLIGVILSNRSNQKITDLKQEQALKDFSGEINNRIDVFEAKIKGEIETIHQTLGVLDEKQEKHNKLIERTYALEKSVSILNTEHTALKSDVDILKKSR